MRTHLCMLLICLCGISASQAQLCNFCGDGSDGAMTVTSDTTLAGGEYNYTSFTIDPGVTLTITGTQPLIIRCTGNITVNGTLDASGGNGVNGVTYVSGGIGGTGVAGGQNGGGGTFASGSGPLDGLPGGGAGAGGVGSGWSGGGGAGYVAAGSSSGGVGGFGGPVYGTAPISGFDAGSGGGGGSGGYDCGAGGGGGGGGYINLYSCGTITIGAGGIIKANGGNGGSDGTGNCGGGGGGSGGSIWLAAPTITNNGTVQAIGGLGGASNVPGSPYYGTGGNGANGRIRVDGPYSGPGAFTPAIGYTTTFVSSVVTVNSISATPDTVCSGEPITLSATPTGGSGPYAYNWMPGNYSGNPTIIPSGSGTYTVTVTENGGCTATATVSVTVNPLPNVNLSGPSAICEGDTATLSGSSGGTSQWYADGVLIPGATSSTYMTTVAGSYNMTKTNLNGCTDSAATGLILTVNALPNVTFSTGNDTVCVTDAAFTLGGSPSGGTFSGSGVSGTTFTPATAGLGAHTLVYTYTDGNSCENSDSITVTVISCSSGLQGNGTMTFSLYPNPAADMINISGLEMLAADLRMTDVAGKTLYSYHFDTAPSMISLPVNGLASGIYYLQVNQEGRMQTRKFSVK